MTLSIVPSSGLVVRVVEGEPRVRDLDLAGALGFADRHMIRRLIARHSEALGEVSVTVTETSERGGRPGREHWLTERQAVYLTTKSDTPRAAELTMHVVDVFLAARRGELVPAESETGLVLAAIRELTGQLMTVRRDVDGLRALTTGTEASPHAIGERAGRRILARILSLATTIAGSVGQPSKEVVRSIRASIDVELRSRLGYSGARRSWARLPSSQHAAADLCLEEIGERERQRVALYARTLGAPSARQPELFS